MKQRRVNDAQVERLLEAMRRDPKYRSELARRVVTDEGVAPGTPEYQRRYKSTMRRFQRYITEAGQKRSFARSPVQYQRQVRSEARQVPPPPILPPPERELPPHALERYYEDIGEPEEEYEEYEPAAPHDSRRDLSEYDLPTLEQTVRAYYDGDLDEAARELNLSERAADLLDIATTGEGADVDGMRGAGELRDALADFLDNLSGPDLGDVRAFHDLLMNLPDWQIGMIIEDLEDGHTTFADWMDAYREDGFDIEDVEDSQYWEIWRAAYKRSKA